MTELNTKLFKRPYNSSQNQQAINDNMTAFQEDMQRRFDLLDMQMHLRQIHEQLADSHHDIVREEARQVKAILLNEVLPKLNTGA